MGKEKNGEREKNGEEELGNRKIGKGQSQGQSQKPELLVELLSYPTCLWPNIG